MPKPKFNGKQLKFIAAVVGGMSASQAALKAGYSNESYGRDLASGSSSPQVAEEIARRLAKQSELIQLAAERQTMESLDLCGTKTLRSKLEIISDMQAAGRMAQDNEDVGNWIKSLTEEFKMMGYSIEKKEITGANGGPVKVESSNSDFDKLSPEIQLAVLEELEALEADEANEEA